MKRLHADMGAPAAFRRRGAFEVTRAVIGVAPLPCGVLELARVRRVRGAEHKSLYWVSLPPHVATVHDLERPQRRRTPGRLHRGAASRSALAPETLFVCVCVSQGST